MKKSEVVESTLRFILLFWGAGIYSNAYCFHFLFMPVMKLVSLFMKNAKDTFVGCPGQIKPEVNRNQITYLVYAKNEEIKLGEVLLFKNYSLQKQIKFSPKKFE